MTSIPDVAKKLGWLICTYGDKELAQVKSRISTLPKDMQLRIINHGNEYWHGRTLMHLAAWKGAYHVLSYLAEHDGDPNRASYGPDLKQTPVHIAVRKDHPECLKVLLCHNGSLSTRNLNGLSPMDIVKGKCREVARSHIDMAKNGNVVASLHDCCKVDAEKSLHDFKNIFHYQLPLTWQDLDTRFTDLKNKNGSAVTLLYRVCHHGNKRILDHLLSLPSISDPLANLSDGCNPLHAACTQNDIETASKLLKRWPQLLLQSENKNERNPLHIACHRCSPDMVALFLSVINDILSNGQYTEDNRLDLNIPDHSGNTLLHFACCNPKCLQVVPKLLKFKPQRANYHPIDVNAKTTDKERTALHIAILRHKCRELLSLLLQEKGVDVYAKSFPSSSTVTKFTEAVTKCSRCPLPTSVSPKGRRGSSGDGEQTTSRHNLAKPKRNERCYTPPLPKKNSRIVAIKNDSQITRHQSTPDLSSSELYQFNARLYFLEKDRRFKIFSANKPPLDAIPFSKVKLTPLAEAYALDNSEAVKLLKKAATDKPERDPDLLEDLLFKFYSQFHDSNPSAPKKKDDWVGLYHKAIERHGSITIKVIRCIMTGPPEVGKSSLKYLLIFNESKEVKISTGVAEAPEIVIASYLAEEKNAILSWKPVDDKVMENIVRTCTSQKTYKHNVSYPTPHMETVPPQKSTTKAPEQGIAVPLPIPTVTVTDSPEPIECPILPEPDHELLSPLDQLKSIRDELLSSNDFGDLDLKEATFVHFIDSGGQPAFQDSLPFLLTLPCTYIQVFNAAEDLAKEIEVSFRSADGQTYTIPSGHGLTTIALMLRSLSSIYTASSKPIDKRLGEILKHSPQLRMFLVGTFKDRLLSLPESDMKRKIESMIANLASLEKKPYYSLIADNDAISRTKLAEVLERVDNPPAPVYWPYLINNMMTKQNQVSNEDAETIEALKSKILSSLGSLGSKNYFELDMPLMWFLLHVITSRLKQKFLKYDLLKQFCIQSQYLDAENADDQFQGMLLLLHKLGFYAYFDLTEKSREWICTDATALYNEVAKVLTIQFKKPLQLHAAKSREFQTTGILSVNHLDVVFDDLGISKDVPKEWLLEILYHLGISAKYQLDPVEYFMPLVLPYGGVVIPQWNEANILCFSYKYSGSHAKADLMDLPRGIFTCLVVHLSEMTKSQILKPKPRGSDRTTACFCYLGIDVYLMEEQDRLELLLAHSDADKRGTPFCERDCHDIQCLVKSTLKNIGSKVMEGMPVEERPELQVGFLCHCDSVKSAHLALWESSHPRYLECQLGGKRLMDCSESVWFPDQFVPTDLGLVLKVLGYKLYANWRDLGVQLGIEPSVLDAVEKNQHYKVEDCFPAMIERWLLKKVGTGRKGRNWNVLLYAIEVVGPESVYEEIKMDCTMKGFC